MMKCRSMLGSQQLSMTQLSDGEREDFDYSEYDKDPLVINFSVGQRLDRGENFDGDPEVLEC